MIEVPVGTQIFSEDKSYEFYDFEESNKQITILKGGQGGLGNTAFKSSVNQAPSRATEGKKRETLTLILSLKLLSNIGLLGLPNAGKSTLLTSLTAATPKIADYPFTTLTPQLGVVKIQFREFTIADIPGIIENASKGSGLGIQFLKHLERCQILLHVIDVTSDNVIEDYKKIRHEIKEFSSLSGKKEIILLNKTDLIDVKILQKIKKEISVFSKRDIICYSGILRIGSEDIKNSLLNSLDNKDVEH